METGARVGGDGGRTGGIAIAPCSEGDWPRVIELLLDVFVGEGHVAPERGRAVNRRERIEPAGTVLTAVLERELLGAVVLPHPVSPLRLMAREGKAEIRMLAVAARARGRGVGEMLVRECLRRAAAPPHSARAVVLWTQPQMTAAQRLYERMGFVRVPERDAVLAPQPGATGEQRLARWAYARPI